MRRLSEIEEDRIALLTAKSIDVTLIEPTETALKKSIMDATASVRQYLIDNKIHDYSKQLQGPAHKVMLHSHILEETRTIPSQASLYRPTTKGGDPRIWFKGLKNLVKPNDILAIIACNTELYLLNITAIDLASVMSRSQPNSISEFLNHIENTKNTVAEELLDKLRALAQLGPIPSVMNERADTAVGRTLESRLGIQINSSAQPDFKGIELKAYRKKTKGTENRKNLFTKVANWEHSKFKSSKEIVTNFGYLRDGLIRLNCTVSTQTRNSQGLKFRVDDTDGILIENSDNKEIGDFAVWFLNDLKKKLAEKHNETFWISAETTKINNNEYFHFTKVLHTRKPIASQFDLLIKQGDITMDHLIKIDKRGRAHEKGPHFKINSNSLKLLFPPPSEYSLIP